MASPAKPPLITPSASPPPVQTSPVSAHRMSENARPSERKRLFSTPRRIIHDDVPSSSTPQIQSPVDVGKEREASIHRLLDHWASLAERYTRRLDEDDIVDLQTGEVTRDYGILRNSRKCRFGALAVPPTGYLTADEGSDSEEDEDDVYDPDELDAFADTYSDTDAPEVGTQYDLEPGGKVVPPVTPLDSADATDLQEFMDAEQRRREMCGSDFGEEEESGLDDPLPEAFEDQAEGECFSGSDELDRHSIEEGEEYISEGGKDSSGEGGADGKTGNILLPPTVADWTSEDELDVWEVDETNDPGPVLNKEDESNHSDSDIEIIEPPTFFTPSKPHPPAPPKNTPTRYPSRIPHQLHTPPQSHASSGSSLTPTRDQSLESKNYSSSRTSTGPITPSLSQPLSPSEHSYPETPTKKAIPRLNLALLSKAPGKHKELPLSSPAHPWRSATKSKPSFPNPRLKPIVLLTSRRSENLIPSTPHSIQPHHRALKNETEEQKPFKSSKGKEKALDIQDNEAELSSPSKSPRRRGRPRKLTNIVVDSESTKLPAMRMQTSPSKRITQDAHPHRAPSNEDSDDPILISPPSHRSSHPSPVEKDEASLFSGTSTSSRKVRESYLLPSDNSIAHELKPIPLFKSQKFMAPPGLRKRKRTISDPTTKLPSEQSPEKRTDRKDSPSRHPSNHPSSSRFIDGKLTLSPKAIC